jgi:hypothetical protein
MLAFPHRGFVLLAMPKCGSTAIERALRTRAGMTLTISRLKHMNAADFAVDVAPLLAKGGYPRDRYEVVSLFREPVDWLYSWWRYRSRPEIADHPNFTGRISFDEFASAYIDQAHPYARVDGVRQAMFVAGPDGGLGVDRVFRYEDMATFTAYLQEQFPRPVELARVNVSPDRAGELSPHTRDRLIAYLEPEYAIYRQAGKSG